MEDFDFVGISETWMDSLCDWAQTGLFQVQQSKLLQIIFLVIGEGY